MARPRKPTELKQLTGTYRPDRDPNPDPVRLDTIEMPTPPAVIANDMTEGALRIWAMVEPGLSGAGLLSQSNLFQLVRYCRLMDEWRMLHKRIDLLTSVDPTPFTNARMLESIKASKVLHDQIMEIDRVFGITPLYADSIKSRVIEEKSDLDKLMEG